MNEPPVLLAAARASNIEGMLQAWIMSKSNWGSFLAMLVCVVLLCLAIFIWAAFFRKTRHPHHSHHHHWRSPKTTSANGGEPAKRDRPRFRFWRRHRQRHRKRLPNPTLAETGGLPPARADGSEPPPAL